MIKSICTILIKTYQLFISSLTPSMCNYKNTCSQYTKQAIAKWGFVDGSILATRYLKLCAQEGKSLRKIHITEKHYFDGYQVPITKPVIKGKEYLNFLISITLYSMIAPLTMLLILNYDLGFSLVLGVFYFLIYALTVILKLKHRKLKILSPILKLNLLPVISVSFPSIFIACTVKSIFEPTKLESQLGLNNKTKLIVAAVIIAVIGLSIMFYSPLVGCVIVLAGYLTVWKNSPTERGNLDNNLGLIALSIGCILFYYSPVFALPLIILWWESNKNR